MKKRNKWYLTRLNPLGPPGTLLNPPQLEEDMEEETFLLEELAINATKIQPYTGWH